MNTLGLTRPHWIIETMEITRILEITERILITREKIIYGLTREKGKAGAAKGKRERTAKVVSDEISPDLAHRARARTYVCTARHETISRLDYSPQPPIHA